jgi:hypothetical protein
LPPGTLHFLFRIEPISMFVIFLSIRCNKSSARRRQREQKSIQLATVKGPSMKTSKKVFAAAVCALAILVPAPANAVGAVVLKENFNNAGALANWIQVNNSNPPGMSWFQGNPALFSAQSGPADSYIGANFLSAMSGNGIIENWLITPELMLGGATHLAFFTRTDTVAGFNDMLEVRFSSGGGTDTSGFSTLLTTIGGPTAYPGTWQQITADLTVSGTGRFAFRYLGDASVANYIGIDTVSVTAVPEPSAWITLGLGLAALSLRRPASRT